MSSQDKSLINLSVHESSDPEMLRRDAESKTGSSPQEESFNPEMLTGNADSQTLDDFNYENEEDREQPLEVEDFDISNDDKRVNRQINIANRHAG